MLANLFTIARRELSTYFTSAIAYITIIVFLSLTVGLYMAPFFTILSADMRVFFTILPIVLCVFLPAVSMRLWAEERKQNTWEMLLTFPIRAYEMTLGKFLASMVFYLSALAGTLVLPVMLTQLGNPDLGPIFGAYLGSLLLGAFFLSLGLFVSAMCRDQIVAFMLTLLACFGFYLAGTELVVTLAEAAWPGLGTLLAAVVGVTQHYLTFTRGLLVLGDVLFFLVWTVVWLLLNSLFLGIRNRPVARHGFLAALALCLSLGLTTNWLLSEQDLGRIDLTQDKLYTLSPASERILKQLPDPVEVRLYITPRQQLPVTMRYLERDIRDQLDDMRLASDGNLRTQVVHLHTADVIRTADTASPSDDPAAPDVQRRLLEQGVRPFSVQVLEGDDIVNKLIYAAIGVSYKDKPEIVIPRPLPSDVETLEYRIMNLIDKLSRDTRPLVALVAPRDALHLPEYMRELYAQMGESLPESEDPYTVLERLLSGERYEVRRLESLAEGIPPETSTIAIIHPRRLSADSQLLLRKALHEGVSVFLAVQQYRWNYTLGQQDVSITQEPQHPEVNDWLERYGVQIDPGILMDVNHQAMTVHATDTLVDALVGSGITLDLPIHITIPQQSMNTDISITSRLAPLFYLWGSALTLQPEVLHGSGLEVTALFSTSSRAWSVPSDAELTPDNLEPPTTGQQHPLAVLVEGQFPPLNGASAAAGSPGKLVVVGNAQMFHRNFLIGGNTDLFLNSIDALTLGDDLIHLRGKKRIDRTISQPSPDVRRFWKFATVGGANLLVAAIGGIVALSRRQRRTSPVNPLPAVAAEANPSKANARSWQRTSGA
ncbi:MAG: Gldg family protein [Candidatus Tectomicrobia bacterium]|nr:Gldg family protein [Candidatus Tectomicrobia bacterium]